MKLRVKIVGEFVLMQVNEDVWKVYHPLWTIQQKIIYDKCFIRLKAK